MVFFHGVVGYGRRPEEGIPSLLRQSGFAKPGEKPFVLCDKYRMRRRLSRAAARSCWSESRYLDMRRQPLLLLQRDPARHMPPQDRGGQESSSGLKETAVRSISIAPS